MLLGFTFSLALERFETRRGLVLEEANALSIVWLQTRLMPSPDRERMNGLLQRYVDHRLTWSEADTSAPPLVQTARMREELWIAATAASRTREPEFLGPDLRNSLETSFNLAAARAEARTSHIPGRVISVLLVYAALSCVMLGYVLQYTGKHHRIAANMLVLLLTIALVLILDIDRPRSGAITISQQPLEQLAEVMRASAPGAVQAPP
ncbi:MAG: hypothetical protein C0481_04650 [Phenylobacterium sp.]|uniref:bestrophin-like domain n=1 Tax=Phenylobacterium sp. TaxID=1871053 RepID=UPI0025EB86B5|nr:hypothetical protein [Phenylobacterium sp.]MBA4011136.1 hypothetical protein [Phenylobacterium sp.]